AIWNAYSFNLGDFPQVRAFTTNHHDFCLIDVLKTKHIETHTFTFFDNLSTTLRHLPAYDVTAENVQDDVEIEVGPFDRPEQLCDVPTLDLVGLSYANIF